MAFRNGKLYRCRRGVTTMRLIDELLKDDFFHGGYQPVPEAPARADDGARGRAGLVAAVAAVFLLLGGGAGGAWYFLLRPGAVESVPALTTAGALSDTGTHDDAPLPTTFTAAATDAALAEAMTAPVTAAAVTRPTEQTPSPAAANPVPQEAPVQTASKPVEPSELWVLAFPTLVNAGEVERIKRMLAESRIEARVNETRARANVYKVVSSAPVAAADLEETRHKANQAKLPFRETPAADDTFAFDLGTYSADDAAQVLALAGRIGLGARLEPTTAFIPAWEIEAGSYPAQSAADRAAGLLTASGLDVKVRQVR